MIERFSLIKGAFPVVLVVLGVGSLLLAFSWKRSVLTRQLMYGVPITGALVGIIAILVDGLALVPYQFPNSYYLWVGLVVLALVVTAIGWIRVGNWRRLVGLLSVVLTALMAMNLINQHYQYYPTIGSLFGVNAEDEVSIQELNAIRDRAARENGGAIPTSGFTIEIRIPGIKSGFEARTAQVWVPPKWVADKNARLPMIILLAGTPGAPQDWTRASFADETAREFANAHGGVAPLIVMPDQNGTVDNDTECVDSGRGNAETYVTVDVPRFMRKTFGALPQPKGGRPTMAIAGLSEGGMCATMLTLRHPDLFAAFADYSGLTGPTVGFTIQPRETTEVLFGGDDAEYDRHNPVWLLENRSFPNTSGWFEVGTADDLPLRSQRILVPLAIQAGVATCSKEIDGGGHNFSFWGEAFEDSLPWLSWKLGLTPTPADESGAVCRP